jgi:plastocyanin
MNLLRRAAVVAFLALTMTNATAGDAPANRQDLEVVLSNFSFAPNMLQLQRGTSYALHLVNRASGGHSFSAPGLFAAVAVAAADGSKVVSGKVEVPAGQTVDIVFTPTTAGTYPVVCSHFLHSTFGMHGEAVIE